MSLKKKFVILLATILLITSVPMIYTSEVSAKEELTWDKINDINVITAVQGDDGLITYKYDDDGNRIEKEVDGIEYLYFYEDGVLTEEQFAGHVVKYISQSNNGDIRFIGREIDGIPYTYERNEMNLLLVC